MVADAPAWPVVPVVWPVTLPASSAQAVATMPPSPPAVADADEPAVPPTAYGVVPPGEPNGLVAGPPVPAATAFWFQEKPQLPPPTVVCELATEGFGLPPPGALMLTPVPTIEDVPPCPLPVEP